MHELTSHSESGIDNLARSLTHKENLCTGVVWLVQEGREEGQSPFLSALAPFGASWFALGL